MKNRWGGSGSEKAFGKLKAALGIEDFEAERVLIPETAEAVRLMLDALRDSAVRKVNILQKSLLSASGTFLQ